ncbi:hypothetical protein OHA25_07170 [Nonomuraea sp. NBC_00507]|uniref:hypothetical protein n=1 Tax=Nonomuraea sp. NBC_00507 TaxID=2976002 RepID=UPI002E1846C9
MFRRGLEAGKRSPYLVLPGVKRHSATPIDDAEDAFAVRDRSNLDAGTLRLPGTALRKRGVAL